MTSTTDRPTRLVTYAHPLKRAPRRKPKAQPAVISGPRNVATKKLSPGLAQEREIGPAEQALACRRSFER
jgi:hypothetical protein